VTDHERAVVVYGGTGAAVIAAIRAALLGADVVVVSPDWHLGGLTSGGLGYTDSGNTRAIGSLAREFYRRVWRHYQQPDAWKWQPRARGSSRSPRSPALPDRPGGSRARSSSTPPTRAT
jgi:hypothetical protein